MPTFADAAPAVAASTRSDGALQFLDAVLPAQGARVLAFRSPGKKGMRHRFIDSNADLLRATRELDAKGCTVYFALAGFDPQPASRRAEHALALRSLWCDIDAKHYGSSAEISSDVARIAAIIGAPSFVVHSGGGVHAYWTLKRDMPTAEWRPLAAAFQAMWQALGVKADPISADAARVLRIPGTHNRKPEYGEPRKVRLIFDRRIAYDPHILAAKLRAVTAGAAATSPRAEAQQAVSNGALGWGPDNSDLGDSSAPLGLSLQEIKAALACLNPDCGHDDWVAVGMALHHETAGRGFALWDAWSARAPGRYPGSHELAKKWRSFAGHTATPITMRSLLKKARAAGYDGPQAESTAGTAKSAPRAGVQLIPAADVQAVPVQWLWPGWLALGKLAILAGDAGTGKTTLALALAAAVTTGAPWPDKSAGVAPGNVIIWSGEDDPADTLKPRLMAAGADMRRVFFVKSILDDHGQSVPFDPARDIPALELAILRAGGASLLIVDPIISAVAGDSHQASQVRRGLQAIVDLGEAQHCAVIGISHFSKGSMGASPQSRVIGSQAFAALARTVLAAAKQEDSGVRVLARAKNNLGRDDGGVSYSVAPCAVEGIPTTRIAWGRALEGTAREILGTVEQTGNEAASALQGAKEFLIDLLADGALPTKEVQQAAKAAAHSWATIRRAREILHIRVYQRAVRDWVWQLPGGSGSAPDEPAQNVNKETPTIVN